MIPCSCAASSASAICRAIGSASSMGIGPCATRSASVGPSTSSSTSAWTPFDFFEAVDRGDIRMVERREHLRLAFEAREPVGIAREELGQDLQRDVTIELRVTRTIDLAHAACAECRDDLVGAEARASGQRHESRLIVATEPITAKGNGQPAYCWGDGRRPSKYEAVPADTENTDDRVVFARVRYVQAAVEVSCGRSRQESDPHARQRAVT